MYSALLRFADFGRRLEQRQEDVEVHQEDVEVHSNYGDGDHPGHSDFWISYEMSSDKSSRESAIEGLDTNLLTDMTASTSTDESSVAFVEFEQDLSRFFARFCEMVHEHGKLDQVCSFDKKSSSLMTTGDKEAARAVLRKELQSFIDEMSNTAFFNPEHGIGAAAHRSTVASLKRQVKDVHSAFQALLRASKEKQVECQNLHDIIRQMKAAEDIAQSEARQQTEQIDRLRERVLTLSDLLDKNLEESQLIASCQTDRHQQHLQSLRKDNLLLLHQNETLKLERDLMEINLKNVCRWNTDAAKSSTLIDERVAELQAIQKQMVEHMEEVRRPRGPARRALKAVERRWSNLSGRLSSVFKTRQRTAGSSVDAEGVENNSSGEVNTPTATEDAPSLQTTMPGSSVTEDPASAVPTDVTPSSRDVTSSTNTQAEGDPQTTASRDFARRFTQLTTSVGLRFRDIEAGIAPSHSHLVHDNAGQSLTRRAKRAMFSDFAAMRHVIARKETELKEMRRELEKVYEKADRLKLELENSRQRRKNFGGEDLDAAYDELEELRKEVSPYRPVFHWKVTPSAKAGAKTEDGDQEISPAPEKPKA